MIKESVETVDRKPVGKEKERSPEKRQPKDNDRPVVPEPAALNEKGASDDEKIDDSPESKSTSSPIPKPSSTKCDPVGPKIAASSSLSELFKKTTRVLWNEDTRTLSPGVKGFWMSIQPRKQRNIDQALDDLFRVAPGWDVFAKWRKKGCLRCAVVGNSKNMLGSGYGSSIDEKDVVFRMNVCPTKGYEKDVGSKTTFHAVYPESASGYRPGARLLLVPFKVGDLLWLRSALTGHVVPNGGFWRQPPASLNANASEAVVLHPDLIYETKVGVKGHGRSYPSTGAMILFASLHLCDEVYMYGFGLGPHGEFGHYFEKSAGISHTSHDGNVETQLRERLEKEKIIKVYKGRYPT
ncbi:CMP-N-acetylneuraminate-beta-galactosamide-alpha-2,3-sialyltransferase 2-like isoform X2 [Oscarella lobularis]